MTSLHVCAPYFPTSLSLPPFWHGSRAGDKGSDGKWKGRGKGEVEGLFIIRHTILSLRFLTRAGGEEGTTSNATPEIISGLFGKKVVLVEGQTEQLALPIYLGKVGLDVLKEGISIISVMGKGNIAKWWRFFQVYDLPAYIIFDNDADDDVDANKRRDALGTIGMIDDETGNQTRPPRPTTA